MFQLLLRLLKMPFSEIGPAREFRGSRQKRKTKLLWAKRAENVQGLETKMLYEKVQLLECWTSFTLFNCSCPVSEPMVLQACTSLFLLGGTRNFPMVGAESSQGERGDARRGLGAITPRWSTLVPRRKVKTIFRRLLAFIVP